MKCENCKKREATQKWLGHGSTMDLIHGNYSNWCEVCVLKALLKHNEKQLRELPLKIDEWNEKLESILEGEKSK